MEGRYKSLCFINCTHTLISLQYCTQQCITHRINHIGNAKVLCLPPSQPVCLLLIISKYGIWGFLIRGIKRSPWSQNALAFTEIPANLNSEWRQVKVRSDQNVPTPGTQEKKPDWKFIYKKEYLRVPVRRSRRRVRKQNTFMRNSFHTALEVFIIVRQIITLCSAQLSVLNREQ